MRSPDFSFNCELQEPAARQQAPATLFFGCKMMRRDGLGRFWCRTPILSLPTSDDATGRCGLRRPGTIERSECGSRLF